MSSRFPILNNRPIDQWKVVELKEELRKRGLKPNGLKEELVRRLDGALRSEMEEAEKEELGNGLDSDNNDEEEVDEEDAAPAPAENSAEPVEEKVDEEGSAPAPAENSAEPVEEEVDEEDAAPAPAENSAEPVEEKVDEEGSAPAPAENSAKPVEEKVDEEGSAPAPAENSAEPVEEKVGEEGSAPAPVESSAEPVKEKVVEEDSAPTQAKSSAEPDKGKDVEEDSAPPPAETSVEPVKDIVGEVVEGKSVSLPAAEHAEDNCDRADIDSFMVANINITVNVKQGSEDCDQKEPAHTSSDAAVEDTKDNAVPIQNSVSDMKNDEKHDDSKPSAEDAKPNIFEPANQVLEVSTDLGFQVKSTDSVSINEKNELKDNLNANNVNLEVVKPGMVQPSSSDVPLDDDKEMADNQASLEEVGDATRATDMEICKKIEGVDEGSPEKLNLDRSSGDESMEEDVLESKQIESKTNSEEGDGKEDTKEDIAQVAEPIDALMAGFSPDKKDMASEEEIKPIAAAEKRKAEDQELVNSTNEPKRQRRWNQETVKIPEPQTSNITTITPKDVFQPALRKSFSRSDSSLGGDEPKERIVPPSQKPATNSLKIDRFLRPFTLKAVQELLGKTGTVSDFWMDQIKTHCYVTYSSVEEATTTRDALYNLQWPPNGGRQLIAEFVDPQEVKLKLELPLPSPVTPGPTTPISPPFNRQSQPPQLGPPRPNLRAHQLQQQQPPQPPLLPPPPPPTRERLPPPPPLPKKPDPPPIMTLDDLFRKTKTAPRIYYLPLSEEQVSAKLAAQGKRAKE